MRLFSIQALWALSFCMITVPAGAQDPSQMMEQFNWRGIGPTVTGGRIVDIAVVPSRPATIFAASASGGLWKTENHGTTWQCVFEKEGTTSIGDICLDPKNPEVIWVGTGEANNQRSSYWGDGVYKSTDGGKSWTHLGLSDTHHIGRIVVDPNNSDTVYVAALGHLYSTNQERGVYKTTDGGKNWNKVLYVSPAVGVVDLAIDPQNPKRLYAASYERIRRAWDFDGAGPGSAIYRSDDAGETWEKLENGLPTGNIGRIGLAVYHDNPQIVYATVSNQNVVDSAATPVGEEREKDVIPTPWGFDVKIVDGKVQVNELDRRGSAARLGIRAGDVVTRIADIEVSDELTLAAVLDRLREGDSVKVEIQQGERKRSLSLTVDQIRSRQVGGEIYRSDDGGDTWVKQNEQPVGGSPAYYYGQIYIDPTNDKQLYVLSVPLYRSSDGGKTWSSAGARSVHVDHHALWIDPANPEHLYLGNDGGFHVSWDRGATWDHVFNLPLAQFYAIGVDMQRPYWVYGGLQDNGTYGGPSRSRNPRGTGRFDWHRIGGGDGFYVQVDPEDANIVFAESQFGVIYRLDRRTGQRRSIRPPQSDPNGAPDRYNWNSPILMSRHNSQTIYFAGNKLFKSYNRGNDWTVISPDLTTANPSRLAGNVPHCTITTIAESPLSANTLMVGTDDGKIHWTDDGGKTWRDISNGFAIKPASWWCSRVELSHQDRNTAYVSFTGYREDDFRSFVFITTDGGATFRSLAQGLPSEPVNVIKQDPRNSDVLYVGTEFGVHVSMDNGKTWHVLDKGLPRIAVHDLVVHSRDRDLVVGTHARGIYILDNVTVLQESTPEVMDKPFHLYSLRDEVLYRSVSTQSISGDRRVLAPNPSSGVIIAYHLKEGQKSEDVSLRVTNASGRTVSQLQANPGAGVHRVTWNPRPGGGRGRFGRGGRGGAPPAASAGPGNYIVELTVGEETQRQMITLLEDSSD